MPLPATTQLALARSLRKYSGQVSGDLLDQIFTRLKSGIEGILQPRQIDGVTVGPNPATVRAEVTSVIDRLGPEHLAEEMNLDFKIDTAVAVSRGAGQFVTSQSIVNDYPGWAFSRHYERDVPRGLKRGRGNTLIEVPEDDWPSRWAEAGALAGDDKWLDWQGDAQTGRGVALKSSGIWSALGELRDDSLGNPYPPFAFNSGFRVDELDRAECIELELLGPNEMPRANPLNTDSIFAALDE